MVYLQVKSGLEECLSLGAVGTSSSLDAQSASYRWLYNQLLPTETVYLEIEDEGEETISLNEVTIYSINGGGPVCTFAYREINIIPVSGSIYQIQNIKGEECLTSNG
ncbi:hypothetical protein Ocin01_09029 [Orchesella cincta]|uniref:Uncharacterized protein n=1 Tax=Orchesella cincta TaxID=48709 RepID=A0A1D2MX70_ORCCI|nr:hypothetical protein Ocin01_09029 [Orchesella cincta]